MWVLAWGNRFLRALNIAQRLSGFAWHEDVKVDILSQYLEGKALSYFNAQYTNWWNQDQSLGYAMDGMFRAFNVRLSLKQAVVFG